MPRTSDLFTAANIRDPRYVWDPTVHKFFGEDLYYFLLRLEKPTEASTAALTTACRRCHIKAYTVYRVYGYYDALVRVWCSREASDELRSRIEKFPNSIIVEFLLYRAYFDDWSTHDPEIDDRVIHRYEKDIRLVSGEWAPTVDLKQSLRRLTQARLLHYQNPGKLFELADEPLIKLYVALVKTAGATTSPRIDIDQVSRAVQSADGLKLKSLYFGAGGGFDCLLKAVIRTKDYHRLDAWIESLYEGLLQRGQNLRPMTLLISSVQDATPDVLDVSGTEIGTAGRRLMRLVGSEFAALVRDLPPEQRNDIFAMFERYRVEFVSTPFERYFLGIIEARLAEDEELLIEKLTFLQYLERRLREFLEHDFFPRQLGNREWFPRIRGVIMSDGRSKVADGNEVADDQETAYLSPETTSGGSRPRLRFTMGQYIFAAREMAKSGALDTQELQRLLGENWVSRMESIINLRNAWAHGRLPELLGGPGWPNWVGCKYVRL